MAIRFATIVVSAPIPASIPLQRSLFVSSLFIEKGRIQPEMAGALVSAASRPPHMVSTTSDFARLAEVREKLPSLQNRAPGAYRWPSAVEANA